MKEDIYSQVVNSQLGGDDIPDLNTTTCIFQSTCKYVFGIAIAFMVGVLKKEILKKSTFSCY
jgi:hypothetical protein